jgi:putative ATPase
MDLFDHARERELAEKAPLAARMRPRTLDEFVGQEHILGPGRLLRRAIEADQLSSLIFYGPPGTGKTTLARIIANTTRAHFDAINAVLAGVADIRKAVADAEARLGQHGLRTILFVDEVHRFNKAQQDALLPHVEFGTVILIGATTENPYFEVNKTVLSRSRIFELRSLGEPELRAVVQHALADPERGYGGRKVALESEALEHLARVANGDARAVLNALELAVETTPPARGGRIRVTLAVAEESIQRKAVLYDKEGDAHFDTISAFIKSLRGSDPDAALYWMARMLYAGEDPRFLLRRMLIFAAEDVGLADPAALGVVESAARAFDYVGLPEGRFHLSEACLYLATAPKSNTTMAFFDALAAVEAERTDEVPNHLKDANRDAEGLGHGQGYQYPHAYRDHWVAQQYLPDNLRGRVFYEPGTIGFEATLQERVVRLREAQLAALEESAGALGGHFPGGAAGEAPAAVRDEDWRLRSQGTLASHLEGVRERMFDLAQLGRHHLVLDARAGAGLLTLEAARRAREGGIWSRVDTPEESEALTQRARQLSVPAAPVVLCGPLEELPALIEAQEPGGVRFDRILARNALGRTEGKGARVALLAGLLAPGGRLVLAEPVPRLGERLLVNWDDADLAKSCAAAGLAVSAREVTAGLVEFPLGRDLLARWFGTPESGGGKLRALLGDEDAERARHHLEGSLAGSTLRRRIAVALLAAERPA